MNVMEWNRALHKLRFGGLAAVLETRAGEGAPPHPHFASAGFFFSVS